jgi:hypothetical protein
LATHLLNPGGQEAWRASTVGHYPQKIPLWLVSFLEHDLPLKATYASAARWRERLIF